MILRTLHLAAACSALAVASPALAQSFNPGEPGDSDQLRYRAPLSPYGPPGFQRLEQGIADLNTLQTSLLSTGTSVDLRSPINFSDVYRGPDGRLYRFDGAIAASFPQSEYYMTRDGVHAAIPGGTVFYIGSPYLLGPEAPSFTSSPNRASSDASPNQTTNAVLADATNLVSSRGAASAIDVLISARPDADGALTLASDAEYRTSRLATLLSEAAAGAASSPR